jgi:RNA polymerase sigma factor (sigma-70 family)
VKHIEMWAKHSKLLYFAAGMISRLHGGQPEDYWGILYERFIVAAERYDPTRGKFSTLFMNKLSLWVVQRSFDSDWHAMLDRHLAYPKNPRPKRVGAELGEDDKEVSDIWEQLPKYINKRDAEAVTLHFRDGCTFKEMSGILGVSRQRVQQRVARAIFQLRKNTFAKI